MNVQSADCAWSLLGEGLLDTLGMLEWLRACWTALEIGEGEVE